jgi:hypothetical protein
MRETTLGSITVEIFKTTAEIYKIGPPKEHRYKEKIESSRCSGRHT